MDEEVVQDQAQELGCLTAAHLAPWVKDGNEASAMTKIVWDTDGIGPPLLLIHGSTTTRHRWLPVRAALGAHFTVHAMDRRGYGESSDGPEYVIDHEYSDIARCVAAIAAGPVDVVAHSYGAVCALGAARLGARIRRLVLYEPPIPSALHPYYPPYLIPKMRDAISRGQAEEAAIAFLSHVHGHGNEAIGAMRQLAAWHEQVAGVPKLLRELEAVERFRLEADQFAGWRIATLLLLGGDSPQQYVATAEALAAALPGSRIQLLPGQRHGAINAAPGLFTDIVLRFLLAPDTAVN